MVVDDGQPESITSTGIMIDCFNYKKKENKLNKYHYAVFLL